MLQKITNSKDIFKVAEVTIWFKWNKPYDVLVVKIPPWNTAEIKDYVSMSHIGVVISEI